MQRDLERDLADLLNHAHNMGWTFEQLDAAVDRLFADYGEERPKPITGSVNIAEPEDKLGG